MVADVQITPQTTQISLIIIARVRGVLFRYLVIFQITKLQKCYAITRHL